MATTQFFESLAQGFVAGVPHVQECGIRVLHLDGESALAVLPYRPEWLGDLERRRIHTGIITTLVDSVSGMAAIAAIGKPESVATLDLRMDYLRPAAAETDLCCRALCHRLTRSIAFVRAEVWSDGKEADLVAIGQATFMRSHRSRHDRS